MKKTIFTLSAAAVFACLLTSCMSGRNSSWVNPEFSERKLGKTVVIAMVESEFRINQFESQLVDQLVANGVDAQSLHRLCPSADEMTEDELTALVLSNKFDSIIVTSVLSADDRQQLIATGYTATPNMGGYRGGYWGGYGMSYSLNPNMALVSNSTIYEIETNLFDVPSQKPVWSGRNEVFDGDSPMKNIQKVVKSVVGELNAEKMF